MAEGVWGRSPQETFRGLILHSFSQRLQTITMFSSVNIYFCNNFVIQFSIIQKFLSFGEAVSGIVYK